MHVLIVDDERLARAELRRMLASHTGVTIVGEAANAAEAALQISALQPDLLLLDVQMPGGSGFDLLATLDDAPEVIFTTAFDQYALQAFEASALDYLMKPIEPQRLAAALERAAVRLGLAPASSAAPRKLFIRDGERCWFVRLEDIRLFESEGNYTRLYFDGATPLLARSLLQLEQRLDPQQFFRANRRHIVNLAAVKGIANGEGGTMALRIEDMTVEVSRRRMAALKQLQEF
ncbi:two component transcriptional regulator, LytTR family [Duganella sp. CF458]|uniref:LytR/AlgR family response regulator transcription factor n=1 Tax=Duganella sp. CF458 TaxID=1884368 RepID=UPI0008E303D6|nr:LytTR family DNA-binding domain-containing protein [Duganella sp. CF458]SFG50400.1 two component transcriptional regulator, LytTR family [Duganella sp. CF458]